MPGTLAGFENVYHRITERSVQVIIYLLHFFLMKLRLMAYFSMFSKQPTYRTHVICKCPAPSLLLLSFTLWKSSAVVLNIKLCNNITGFFFVVLLVLPVWNCRRESVAEETFSALSRVLSRLLEDLQASLSEGRKPQSVVLQLTAECFRCQRNACVQNTRNQDVIRCGTWLMGKTGQYYQRIAIMFCLYFVK